MPKHDPRAPRAQRAQRAQRDEDLWRDFGVELRRLREDHGWSVPDLVARTREGGGQGVSRDQILKIEHGGYRREAGGEWETPNPKDDKLAALARALGIDPNTWFARVGRYAERERTRQHVQTGGHHRQALSERIRELEAEVGRMRARQAETDALLREHGIGEPEAPARRRSHAQPQTAD